VTIEPDRIVSGRDPGDEVALDRALRPTTLAGQRASLAHSSRAATTKA
jgi:hypothetical protein